MKTPEENKCGMECIRTNVKRICVKPEKGQCHRCEQLVSESLARIQQLESRLAQVEKERDAAVSDLEVADKLDCQFCVHNRPTPGCEYDCEKCENKCTCNLCRNNDKYEWRGVCAENTEEEN